MPLECCTLPEQNPGSTPATHVEKGIRGGVAVEVHSPYTLGVSKFDSQSPHVSRVPAVTVALGGGGDLLPLLTIGIDFQDCRI